MCQMVFLRSKGFKEKYVTISGEGTGEDCLEDLGESKSDEFSPAWCTETDT